MESPTEELRDRLDSTAFRLYAQFGRRRGGLLYVAQAIILTGQLGITAALARNQTVRWHDPLLLLPLYLLYFLTRDYIWSRFYRRNGHIDEATAMNEAKTGVWVSLVIPLLVGLGNLNGAKSVMPAGGAVLFTEVLVLWAALAVRGRLPVDSALYTLTFVLLDELCRGYFKPSLIWLFVLAAIATGIYGIWEHYRFIKLISRKAAVK